MAPARIATRLTCFALISAIENDFRKSIILAINRLEHIDVFPEDVRKQATKRWEQNRGDNDDVLLSSDLDLLDFIDFADIAKVIHRIANEWGVIERDEAIGLADKLLALAPLRNRVCHSRPLESDDFAA